MANNKKQQKVAYNNGKHLINKLWWLNVVGVVILLTSLGMLIANPLIGLDSAYEAIWATTFTSTVKDIRNEGKSLLDVFILKFSKDNRLKRKKK